MAIFNKFPFSNAHELNLDWILRQLKDLLRRVKILEQSGGGGGGGGTSDYNDLSNKPSINGVQLIGNKTTAQLKLDLIFWVTMGTTTYAEVTAALNAGKLPVISDTLGSRVTFYIFSEKIPVPGAAEYLFVASLDSGISNNYTLNENNVWSNKQIYRPHDIPAGGTSGQVLAKSSNSDYQVTWITPPQPQQPGTDPKMNGTPAVGTSTEYSRSDHVHPSDTSKITAPVNPITGNFLKWNGSAWVDSALPVYNGGWT